MIPKGIRNKNPGNIEISDKFTWEGEVRPSLDGRFCTFVEPVWGLRAMMKLLINYNQKHNIKTIRAAVHRWAPPNENASKKYAETVADWADIGPDVEYDFTQLDFLVPVCRAMVRYENGTPGSEQVRNGAESLWWYPSKVYQDAYELAVKGRLVSHTRNEIVSESFTPEQKGETKMQWLSDRLKERSTWAGFITVVTSFGVTLAPDMAEAIIAAGVSLGGLLFVFTKDA